MEKLYGVITRISLQAFGDQWHLAGKSLAYFMRNYTLKGCYEITIAHSECPARFDSLITRTGFIPTGFVPAGQHEYVGYGGVKIRLQQVPQIKNTIKEFPKDYDRMELRFPENIGKYCDEWDIDWTEKINHQPYPDIPGAFFSEERRANGHDLITNMLLCGKEVGIEDKMFLGFGNVLGYALLGNFLPKDNDIDMCILVDELEQEQILEYVAACKARGLMDTRERGPFSIGRKYCWMSIGQKSIKLEQGVKACNWFCFSYDGKLWHSKGNQWVSKKGLHDEYPTAKGIPLNIALPLKKVMFGGNEIQVPKHIGRCLDAWYPGWVKRKPDSSRIDSVLVMPDTFDKSSWCVKTTET